MQNNCSEANEKFRIRTMGFSELAQMYSPDIAPESAANLLRRWIARNDDLKKELKSLGYKRYCKVLTPNQVSAIIDMIGAP